MTFIFPLVLCVLLVIVIREFFMFHRKMREVRKLLKQRNEDLKISD